MKRTILLFVHEQTIEIILPRTMMQPDGNAASCAHIISGFVGINFAKMMGEITLKNVYTTTK